MRRKNETTQIIKEYISESLLLLMSRKKFEDITIAEVAQKAGVNRSTYYRNFDSKKDIVKFYFDSIMSTYLSEFEANKNKTLKIYLLTMFSCFYRYKKELLSIHSNGLSYLILEALNSNLERYRCAGQYLNAASIGLKSHVSDVSCRLDKIPNVMTEVTARAYFHTGGIYNFFILWFSAAMKESPEEVTDIALSLFPPDFKPLFADIEKPFSTV